MTIIDILLILCGVGALLLAAMAVGERQGAERVALKERLASLAQVPGEVKGELPGAQKEARIPKLDLRKVVGQFTGQAYMERLERDLAQADIPIRVSEFLILRGVGILLGFGLTYLKTGNAMMGLLGAGLMFFMHIPVIKIRKSMRITKFVNQLAEFLSLVTNSLRAGQTFLQGVDIACKDSPNPIAHEFKQLIREVNLGLPVEQAFDNMQQRVPSEEIKIVMSAFTIQRKVGGNLADILAKVAEMIRERIRIQGQIRVLTTQGKLSGAIVGLLPFGLGFFLSIIAPDYMKHLYKDAVGWVLVGLAVFMQLLGCFVIYKICDIDV
jgi:tight adherence protein B